MKWDFYAVNIVQSSIALCVELWSLCSMFYISITHKKNVKIFSSLRIACCWSFALIAMFPMFDILFIAASHISSFDCRRRLLPPPKKQEEYHKTNWNLTQSRDLSFFVLSHLIARGGKWKIDKESEKSEQILSARRANPVQFDMRKRWDETRAITCGGFERNERKILNASRVLHADWSE